MAAEISMDDLAGFDESAYPVDFLREYEMLECLAQNALGETILVKGIQTGRRYVAKCYPTTVLYKFPVESRLLQRLDHPGVPAFIAEYQGERMLCIVREYIPGTPLDQLAQERPFTQQQAVNIALQLCEILEHLHTQIPPVIHRDIKPQNVIINEMGKVTLIDFGISRIYVEGADADTATFGTRDYAAPEQYGFSQTNNRSDIYSLGVLLCWMLTGKVDVSAGIKALRSSRLARVIKKCTSFDPRNRYASVTMVRDALTGRTRRRGLFLSMTAALVCLSIIFSIFLSSPNYRAPSGPAFSEPLIEQAVRLQLGKAPHEALTMADLMKVEELYIFGNLTAPNSQTFDTYVDRFVQHDETIQRGSIYSLGDLKQLPNLRRISIDFQHVSDLSPLAELTRLENVDLRHNPVEDATPLSRSLMLRDLVLFDTAVSDLTALSACPNLSTLDIGLTRVTSLKAVKGLSGLRVLLVRKAPVTSLDQVESLSLLEEIYLSDTGVKDLTPLFNLPKLTLIEVDAELRPVVEAGVKVRFKVVYR